MSESEFRVRNPTPAPGYAQAVISALREGRKEHPVADMLAGNLPLIGGIQAGMDATDPDASDFQRMLAVGSVLPGMRLMRGIIGKLRKVPKSTEHVVESFHPEDIFQKPNPKVTTSPETVSAANKAYAEQLLKEGDDPGLDHYQKLMERVRAL